MNTPLKKENPSNEDTKITNAAKALRASELSYRRLFEAAKDGILILEPHDGRIVDVNPFLVHLLGFSHAEMVGKTVGELSPFKDVVSNQAMLERLQNEGYVRYEDLPLETKDGRHIAVEFVCNLYAAGDLNVIQCNIRDITERRKTEESLRLLESAVAQTQESIVITDAELKAPGPTIVFVNAAFTQMTGYTAAEAVGKSPRFLQGRLTNKAVLDRLRENLERGEPFAGESINYRKDGTEFNLDWQIGPVRDAGGKITHFVAVQRDVTEKKKLEAQFRQSQKMEGVGQLAGGVAHDFNNILAVIQMQSDLLRSGGLSNEQTELAEGISTEVKRAATLTRQLLLFSSREICRPQDIDLSDSIANTAKMLMRVLGEDVRMQLKLATQPMFIHADAGMMDQVLLNLTVNARDAMPNGGQLIIETSGVELDQSITAQSIHGRPGSYVCLSVTDSGCGIPPAVLPKIFEPFFTTKDVGKGTGLGLSICFGIVRSYGGSISVNSEPGKFCRFVGVTRMGTVHICMLFPAESPGHKEPGTATLLREDENGWLARCPACLEATS